MTRIRRARVLIFAIAGSLVFVAMPEHALAQWERSVPLARELLRRVLDVARRDDLSDAGLLGKSLGLQFGVGPEQPYVSGGQRVATIVRIRLETHDSRIFDLDNQPFMYEVFLPAGKLFKRVMFTIGLSVRNVCVTADDFQAVFGPTVEKYEATDFGGIGYQYTIRQKNEIRVSGFLGHGKCMRDLTLSQNQDRRND
jgi:hypothetical protein